MWAGSHFGIIWSWAFGETSVHSVEEYLMNFCTFPDLAQEEAAINNNEKSFPVEGSATLEGLAEMNGEMYVPKIIFVFLLIICHHRF